MDNALPPANVGLLGLSGVSARPSSVVLGLVRDDSPRPCVLVSTDMLSYEPQPEPFCYWWCTIDKEFLKRPYDLDCWQLAEIFGLFDHALNLCEDGQSRLFLESQEDITALGGTASVTPTTSPLLERKFVLQAKPKSEERWL